MKKWLALSCVMALLDGCTPFIPVVKIDKLPADQRATTTNLPVYEASDLVKLRYTTIAQVEGFSCKFLLWSPGATRDNAVDQVKYWAFQKGANAITNLTCDSKEGVSLVKNCWETVRCTADAIKAEK